MVIWIDWMETERVGERDGGTKVIGREDVIGKIFRRNSPDWHSTCKCLDITTFHFNQALDALI